MRRFWLWLARRRTSIQALSTVLLNSVVTAGTTKGLPCPALNCHACPAAAFACPIGNLQHFAGRHEVPFYVLGVVGLAGALAGRAACGWLCPFGWIQELVYRLPVPKLRLANRCNWTRYAILAILAVAVPFVTGELWFCKLCPAGMLEGGIPAVLLYADLRPLVGGFYWLKLAILGGFLAWMSVTRRPFCRWVCPLGALWSPFNAVSALRLHVDQERCLQCDRCREVCPMDIRVYEAANSGTCIRCLACLRACPVSCISVTPTQWSLEADRTANPGAA